MDCQKLRLLFAKWAVEETQLGQLEDKVVKNHFASEYVFHMYKNLKTCDVIEENAADGITTIAEPVGPILGITPVTNPTSTVIFKSLLSIKTRNAIMFLPHPRSQKSSYSVADFIRRSAIEAGAPDNLVMCAAPSKQLTAYLMQHPAMRLVLATGGPAMVRSAYSCGKPAIGVGAGNAPVIIDETADVVEAVSSVVIGKTFDNSTVCASEQALVVVEPVYESVKQLLQDRGAYLMSPDEKQKVAAVLVTSDGGINPQTVGQSAATIASMAGISVPVDTVLLFAEVKDVGPQEPLSGEKLCPVLALFRASDFAHALQVAVKLARHGGLGHTAGLHTSASNSRHIALFQMALPAFHLLINTPTSLGAIGSAYNSNLEPSLTLGCGTTAGSSTSVNVGPMQLVNLKKVVHKRDHIEWFKIPRSVLFNRGAARVALQDLCHPQSAHAPPIRPFIVTDKNLLALGVCHDALTIFTNAGLVAQVWADVDAPVCMSGVRAAVAAMEAFNANVLVAIGGGTTIDFAKVMQLLYEVPGIRLDDVATPFIELRHRTAELPMLRTRLQVTMAIPTTSGTGAEMTPFSVVTGDDGSMYPLCSYALTPHVAVVDADYARHMPRMLAATTGIDALTHAVEAHVSVYASPYTRPYSKRAFVDLMTHLPRCCTDTCSSPTFRSDGRSDPEVMSAGSLSGSEAEKETAREKVHNASSIAGLAFANAFLGLCHSIAHHVEARFRLPHGVATAIALPYVIRYNATLRPTRQAIFPQHTSQANTVAAYIDLASAVLTFPPNATDSDKVDALIRAVEAVRATVGIRSGLREYSVDEGEFHRSLDELALGAFNDQCTGTNPRYPLIPELRHLLILTWTGAPA